MRNTGRNNVLTFAATALAILWSVAAIAQSSALVEGTTADVWVVDPETGQVTGYDTGRWVSRYFAVDYTGINLGPDAVVLVNRLPASSLLMTPGQPAISLLGIGDAALNIGDGGAGGHRDLTLSPVAGSYTDTIAVVIGVSAAVLTRGDHRLTWSVVDTPSQATVVSGSTVLQQNAGATGENGNYYETFYLTNSGNYAVNVTLRGGFGATDVSASANYQLSIPAGKERRDTDGDGIPDSVEADIGLNPFTDDWTADTDGNGWSEFDEWLRRFCLDPTTLQPLDGAAACLDADGVPLDSDNDNWADFDEILRGTNHLDAEPVITGQTAAPPGNMDDADPAAVILPVVPGSEYETRQRLRFKDFPAANRLYEVEHRIDIGAGVIQVPPLANLLPDQQSNGLNQGDYKGIVVQSFTPTQDNIAGIDFRVAAGIDGVEDVILNIWADALRDGELLYSQRLRDVGINGDPDRPIAVRFEAVAVQSGQPIFFEFRKRDVALVTTGADTLGGGGVVEVDGVADSGLTDLVFSVFYDANFANGIGGTRASMQWWNLAAADLAGSTAYDATTLLRDDEITSAGLVPTDIAPRRRMTTLANAFGSSRLPEMRLPAGNSVVVSAVLRNSVPPQPGWQVLADYSRIYKGWLSRSDDVTPISMLAELGEGTWTTPEEWRREFIAYLVPRLVLSTAITLGEASTLRVAVVEAALTEEAQLEGSGDIETLAPVYQPGQPIHAYQPGQPVYGDHATTQSIRAATWEESLARLAVAGFNLDQSLDEVAAALGPGMPLEPLGAWLRERFYAGEPGSASDRYMAQQVRRSFDQSCFVNAESVDAAQANVAGWNAFLDRCPVWFDETELAQHLDESRDRRYLVRLNLLPGATTALANDATLLDLTMDSDADGALNGSEVEVPVPALTLPWLFDSDGDTIADGSDPCPLDPYNDCSANPIRPTVVLEDDFVVFEPIAGSDFAIISVQLSRIYDVPVTVCYEALMAAGDTASPGTDFEALTGCVVIAPGQLSALIAIPIFADGADEGAEWFTVRITSVNNATVADDGVVIVTLNDTAAGGSPIIVLANNNIVVNERAAVNMSAAGSSDPGGGALSFAWRQIDNGQPAVTLNGASTAQASFTAPTTLVPVVLIFEVAASNASLLTSTAQVTVTVNPVNDPPFATGTPFAQVISGNSFEWADETLLAFVSDPENDPLSLGAISQQPGIGSVVDTGNGYTYTSDQGGDLKLSDSQIDGWVLNGTGTHVVLNESGPAADFPGTQRVVAVELATGARTLLLEGDYGTLLRRASDSSALYFRDGNGVNLYRFDPNAAQPLLSAPVPVPFPNFFVVQESAVDPFTGDLHYCMKDAVTNDRNWYRVDVTDMSVNVGNSNCGSPVGMIGGRMGKRFCVLNQTNEELVCTAPNGNVLGDGGGYYFGSDPTDPGANYDVVGIRQVGDALFVFTSKNVFNSPQNLKVWLAHDSFFTVDPDFPEEGFDFEPKLLLESPLGMQDDPPEVEVLPDGRAVMVIAKSQNANGDGESREMWTWSGDLLDDTMTQLNIGNSPTFQDHLGKLKYVNGKLYWHVQDQVGNTNREIYEVDPTPGALNALQLVATVPGTFVGFTGSQTDFLYGSSQYDIFATPAGEINVLTTTVATGVCDLVEPLSGNVVKQWVGCLFHASVPNTGSLLNLDEETDGDVDIDNLYLLGGSAGATGATSFSVEVTDGEFVIDLPVNIEVLPP